MDRISVLIADDHSVFRRGLRSFLESEGDINIVGEAASGEEAIQMVETLLPDVVVMDLVMPGVDGITATRRICQISPTTRVLVLTSFGEDEKIFSSIKAGAMGYLLKDVSAEDLGRAIHLIAQGEFLLHPQIAKRVLDEFTMPNIDTTPITELTPREIEILNLIYQGLSNKEIANHLDISIKTVKTHVSNILNKLHLIDRTQAALYAVRHGLVNSPKPKI
jgi:two-component system, NarL family, response regulator LiaR